MSFFFTVPEDDEYDHLRGNEYEVEPESYQPAEHDVGIMSGYFEYFTIKDMDGNQINDGDSEYISDKYNTELQDEADDSESDFFNEPD